MYSIKILMALCQFGIIFSAFALAAFHIQRMLKRETPDPIDAQVLWVKAWRKERGLARVEPTFTKCFLIPLAGVYND